MKNNSLRSFVCVFVCLSLGVWCGTASALIEVKLTVTSIFKTAQATLVGEVSKVNLETGGIEGAVKETLSGKGFDGPFRILLKSPEVLSRVKAGQPIILFPSQRDPMKAMIHLGDAWVLGEKQAGSAVPFYLVKQEVKELSHSFPGRTASLRSILLELKANKPEPLLDKADPRVLTGGIKSLGKLPVTKPLAIRAVDAGNKKMRLAVATTEGVKTFELEGAGFVASSAKGPPDFPAKAAAVKPSDAGDVLAVVQGEFSETGSSSLVVRTKGLFREAASEKEGTIADDFKRLTGDPITTFLPAFAAGTKTALLATIDLNGDGKPDAVLFTEEGGLALINRGYGAFFVVPGLTKTIAGEGKPLPFAIKPGTVLCSADLNGDKWEDLIAVTEDGEVYLIDNPVPPPAK